MHIIENPMIPLTTPIMNGMNCDAKIDIHGNAYSGHHMGFVVELLTPTGSLLHMSVRFNENCVVFNHFECGRWHHEERHCNPFCIGGHFHLKIKNHHGHFAVHVNGHHLAHFHHRGDTCSITALHVRGDVMVQKVHFERFIHHNGGGVQIGGGAIPMAVAPMYMPPAPVMVTQPPVVVVEEGHHHHHHHRHHGGEALGLGAALLGGAIIGGVLGSHHHHHGHHGGHGHHW